MRSNLILSLTATAFGFGIVGVSAAPMDLTSHAAALQANITAGNLQPLASMGFNQKGLAAIKPAGAGPSQSTLTSNDIRSSVSKMGAVNMIRHPELAGEPAFKQRVVRLEQNGNPRLAPSSFQIMAATEGTQKFVSFLSYSKYGNSFWMGCSAL